MAKKRNRCRVKSCSIVIPEKYHFCYMHRLWSHHDVREERSEMDRKVKPPMSRFFCDPCGTVIMSQTYTDCRACGSKTEALS